MPSPLAPTSLPLPSLSLHSFVKNLSKFDILQDFHLPDDQFASLKLHKLRQVAVETGVEPFSSPSYCTRRSVWRYALSPSSSDIATPLPVPPGSTPTVPSSPNTVEVKHTSTPSGEERNTLTAHDATELSEQEETEGPRPESSTESVPADGGHAADSVDGCKEGGAGLTDCPGKFHPEENQGLSNHTDDSLLPKTPSFSCQLQRTVEEPLDSSTVPHNCDDPDADSVLSKESPAKETKICSEPNSSPGIDSKNQKSALHHSIQSQLLLSPPLGSALLTTPQLPSSSLTSSPSLPSLGVTPQSVPAALPLTSSPSVPTLILPPPHSPSTQALSPPPLSPCPSLPPSQVQVSCQLVHTAGPANEPHVSSVQPEGSEGKAGLKTQEAEEDLKSCTHTLKVTDFICCNQKADLNQNDMVIFVCMCAQTPSGGCLVDACCLPGSSGLCVAAAGKWAVCLWTQISASDWNLSHTWSFNEVSVWASSHRCVFRDIFVLVLWIFVFHIRLIYS